MKFFMLMSWLITELVFSGGNIAVAGTSYYRWQDVQGDWHFSDQPPASPTQEANVSKVLGEAVNTSKPTTISINHTPTQFSNQPSHQSQKSRKIARQLKQKSKQKQACHTLKVKLDAIHTKLRAGYKEPKGNKLREQRRKINNKIYHQC